MSFKKCANDISKICLYLTHINKELNDVSLKIGSTLNENTQKKSLWFVTLGLILSFLVSSILPASWIDMLTQTILKYDTFLNVEFITFCIAITIYHFLVIYPVNAISADFVVCHLLCELGQAFDKWRGLMKFIKNSIAPKVNNYGIKEKLEKNNSIM